MTQTLDALGIAPAHVNPDAETEEPKEAHIVRREDQMRGYIAGEPIMALCGKTWVPSRDYTGLPVCQRCEKVKAQIIASQQGSN